MKRWILPLLIVGRWIFSHILGHWLRTGITAWIHKDSVMRKPRTSLRARFCLLWMCSSGKLWGNLRNLAGVALSGTARAPECALVTGPLCLQICWWWHPPLVTSQGWLTMTISGGYKGHSYSTMEISLTFLCRSGSFSDTENIIYCLITQFSYQQSMHQLPASCSQYS